MEWQILCKHSSEILILSLAFLKDFLLLGMPDVKFNLFSVSVDLLLSVRVGFFP